MMKDRPSPIISRSKSIQSELNRVAHSFRSRKNTQEDIPAPKPKTPLKLEETEAVSLSSLRAMEELLTVPSPTNTLTFKNSINNLSYLDRSSELIPRYFPSPTMQNWDVHRRGPSAPTGGFQSYSLHSTPDLTNLSSHNSDSKLNSTVSELSLPKDIIEEKIRTRSFTNKSYSYDDLVNSQGQNIPPSLPAPAPAMYWSVVPSRGQYPTKPLRAHSAELVGDLMYVFGGCNSKGCFNDLFIFDTDTMYWRKPIVSGTPPLPSRAHSSTLIDDKIYIFGGGNGDQYYNSLHIFDTVTLRWSTPHTLGDIPCPRRAHSACAYKGNLYIFGGGDGMRALNDVYQLDISDPLHLTWKKLEPEGDLPVARGYHTSNLVGNQWIVYGGSDGADCFNDIHILDLESLRWAEVNVPSPQARLSHTATLVGPFFFVVGGRDEKEYTNHLLILNLATMKWEQRKTCGAKLSPRGYHTTILHDSRLYVFGGYDGKKYFNHVYILDLSASAYLPRMNNFELRTVPMAQSHTI